MQKEVIIGIVITIPLLLLVIIWAIFVRKEKYAKYTRPNYPIDVNENNVYEYSDNQNDVNAYTPNPNNNYNDYYPNDGEQNYSKKDPDAYMYV